MRKIFPDIENLRKQVVDTALIIIAVVLTLSLAGVVNSIIMNGFTTAAGVIIVIVVLIDVLVLIKNRISANSKTLLVLFLITITFIVETVYWGLLVSSESYIILVLIFFFGFLTFRKSVIFALGYIALYLLIGLLFHKGILEVRDKYNVPGYLRSMIPWIVSTLHIFIATFAVLFAMYRFSYAYVDKISSLKASESKYRSLSETANTGIWQLNTTGETVFINAAMCSILEVKSQEELSGSRYIDFIDAESRAIVEDENNKRVLDHSSTYEIVLLSKKGTKKNVVVTGSPLYDTENRIIGSIGTFIDVTPIKKTKTALAESEKRFREMAELLPQVVYESDPYGFLTYVNINGQKEFGVFDEELKKGVNILSTIDPSDHDRLKENIAKVASQGHSQGNEYLMVRKDGTRYPALIYSSPILKEGKYCGLRGTVVDITERKRLEQDLEQHRNHLAELVQERTEALAAANEELLATNEELFNQREELENILRTLHETQDKLVESEKMASLGVLASGISHEINNPLNFIQGGLYGVEDYINSNIAEHKEGLEPMFQVINEGIKRASKIVSSLNHFSRKTESQNEDCDIHKIIENCLTMLHNQLKNKIVVKKHFSDNILSLKGNEGKLHQAILNILSNAEQSINEKGTITIKTVMDKRDIVITVSDTGTGISQENLSRVFDPFFTTKDPGKGTGLGLSITYNIIKDHGGDVSLKSKAGKGTEVIIKLPAGE